MYVFSHLHKAAGTSIVHLLRRSYGFRHLDVSPARGHIYTADDLQFDLSHFAGPLSIAGHGLRPHVDYGKTEAEMHWYTVIRDPLDRCISHYQHQVQKMGKSTSFIDWISRNLHRNWMVYFYGGSGSLQSAIDSISGKKMRVIDMKDGFREGIESIFPDPLQWKDHVANPAKNNLIRDEIMNDPSMMEELLAANELDLQLYSFMKSIEKEALPEQKTSGACAGSLNTALSFFYRNALYRPLKKASGFTSRGSH